MAVVDNHGTLVYYEMMDDTQTASAHVAIEKAKTSATFRRPTKEFEDGIAGGRNWSLQTVQQFGANDGEFVQGGNQGFRHIASAVASEVSEGVRFGGERNG